MKSSYRIGSVWGIPVNLHISLFLLMGYVAVRSGLTGFQNGGLAGGAVSVAFILSFEVLLFASIALHELGHSFVAIRKGCRVREITLMFIGGAAKMEAIPRRPLDEFLMAVAGPAVSAAIGTVCIAIVLLTPAAGGGPLVWFATLFFYLGIVNFILAGFNLLPAFPMDGGRIFRAIMTPKLGRRRATLVAARLGRGVAVLIALVGLFGLPGLPFLNGGNFFMVVIAGFIFVYGDREYRVVQVEELMQKRGFGGDPAPFTGAPSPEPPDDNTVLISPPPYAQGPARRAEIRRTRPATGNPFRDIFER